MSHRRLRLLEGLWQAPEDIRVVLGFRGGAGVDSLGMACIGQHGSPCGLLHPPLRRLEPAVLRRPLAGPVDQVLEGRLCPGPLSQLRELRVGPALPPLTLGRAVTLGRGVGLGVCGGVMVTGGGGGPGGVLVVLCLGGCVGVRGPVGTRARSRLRGWAGTCGGSASRASAGCGPTSAVGRGAGMLAGALALLRSSREWSLGLGYRL